MDLDSNWMAPRLRLSIAASKRLAGTPSNGGESLAHGLLDKVAMAEQTISELLRLLEEHLSIRAAFVARASEEEAQSADGCVLAPRPSQGAGIGVPIRLADGHVFGMLCFFRTSDEGQLDDRDVRRLQMSARVAARMIDGAYAHGIAV